MNEEQLNPFLCVYTYSLIFYFLFDIFWPFSAFIDSDIMRETGTCNQESTLMLRTCLF